MEVELAECEKHAVGKANEQTRKVESSNACRGHHDDVGNDTNHACSPQRPFSTNKCGNWTAAHGADECSQDHKRGDELLPSMGDIVAYRGGWVLLAKNLVDVRALDGHGAKQAAKATHMEKSRHCLKTTNDTEVCAILKWTHANQGTGGKTFPVGQYVLLPWGRHVDSTALFAEEH